jgi:hypothetical protein
MHTGFFFPANLQHSDVIAGSVGAGHSDGTPIVDHALA